MKNKVSINSLQKGDIVTLANNNKAWIEEVRCDIGEYFAIVYDMVTHQTSYITDNDSWLYVKGYEE